MQQAKRTYSTPNRILFWSMLTLTGLCCTDIAIASAKRDFATIPAVAASGISFSAIAGILRAGELANRLRCPIAPMRKNREGNG